MICVPLDCTFDVVDHIADIDLMFGHELTSSRQAIFMFAFAPVGLAFFNFQSGPGVSQHGEATRLHASETTLSPLMALSGHPSHGEQCLLLGKADIPDPLADVR